MDTGKDNTIPDRDHYPVRHPKPVLAEDLQPGSLLTLDREWVIGGIPVQATLLFRILERKCERLVIVTIDLYQFGTMDTDLHKFCRWCRSGNEYHTSQSPGGSHGSQGTCCITGRGSHDRIFTSSYCFGYHELGCSVLKRAARIEPVILEPDIGITKIAVQPG